MPWDALSNPYGNGFKVGTKARSRWYALRARVK